jgi:hypothetical protein
MAMRNLGGIVIGGLWLLLLLAYTAPFWLPGFISWDFAVSVHLPGGRSMAAVLLAVMLLLPPFVLGIVTWRWLAR